MTGKLRLAALEPRILLDAAAVATVAEQAAKTAGENDTGHDGDHGTAQSGRHGETERSGQHGGDGDAGAGGEETRGDRTIIVADVRAGDLDALIEAAGSNVEVYLVEADESGIAAIAEALGRAGDVTALHIVSHGSDGNVSLGSDTITSAGLTNGQGQGVAGWSAGLSSDADILIYGCDVAVGSDGRLLVQRLADLTGADVSASSDATGAAALGGDWDLEVSVGSMETDSSLVASLLGDWHGLLVAPSVSDAATATRSVAEDATLSFSELTVSGSGSITIQITLTEAGSAPADGGHLSFNGSTGTNLSMTGTAAEINAALAAMQYTTSDNFNGAAQLAIVVTNGDGSSNSAVSVNVTPVNDAPSLDGTRTALTVQEGESGVFGTANFELRDTDLTSGAILQVTEQEMVRLTSLPTSGKLILDGSPVVVGTVFSYADIANLVYVHDGSDVPAGGLTDSFTVTLNDGGGSGDVGPFTIGIDITSKNTAPTVSADLSVYEGEGSEVSRSTGQTTDGRLLTFTIDDQEIDHADALENMTFVIDQISLDGEGILFVDLDGDGQPDGGEFAGAAGSELLQGGTYTLTYAQFQQLRFRHDGSEPDAANPSFRLTVTDAGGGEGAGGALSTSQTFEIRVLENDDDPVLNVSAADTPGEAIEVDAGTSVVIDNTMLQASDVDGGTLVYTVTAAPEHGYLEVFRDGSWVALGTGGRFTQEDIDSGNLRYTQWGGAVDGLIDSFQFEVRDSRLRAFNGSGDEGAVRDANFAVATNSFHFALSGTTAGGGGQPDPVTIQVQSEVNAGSHVAQEEDSAAGSIDTSLITTADLQYVLASSDGTFIVPAAETWYRLTTVTQNGTLQYDRNGDGTGWTDLSLYDVFTQADVDAGRIRYVHDGSESHLDSFSFSVSNGQDPSFAGVFEISVAPTNDRPVAGGGTKDAVPERGTVRLEAGDLNISDADDAAEAGEPNGEASVDELWFRITDLTDDGTLQRWDGTTWVDVTTSEWMHSSLLTMTADGGTSGLRYVHDGGDVVSGDAAISSFLDSFDFVVRDDLAAPGQPTDVQVLADPTDITGIDANLSETGTVTLNIAPLNDAPIADLDYNADGSTTTTDDGGADKTTANQRLEVAEGATATITNAMLQAVDPDSSTVARQFRIMQSVQYGTLYLDGVRLGVGATFTQDDIDNGRLTYEHDGSEARADYFLFVVSDSVTDHVHNLDGDTLTPTDGAAGESRFDIIVPDSGVSNDVPTISANNSSVDVTGDPATNPLSLNGLFTIADSDLDDGTVSSGEQDFMQVMVRLLDSAGNAVDLSGSGGIVITNLNGATQISYNAATGEIVFQGTLAQVRAALNSIDVTLPDGDHNDTFEVEVTVDDRLRDGSGGLTAGANGDNDGTVNEDGSTIDSTNNRVSVSIELRVSGDNDPPVVTVPGAQITYEDVALDIVGVSIDDVDAFGESLTVTLSVTNGTISVAGGGASVSNNGTATVTLTGTVAEINGTLANLTYTGQSNWFGSDTLTVQVSDGGALGADGAQTDSDTIAITVQPLNDAPDIGADSDPVTISSDGFTAVDGFAISDVDIDGDVGVGTGETDFFEATIRLLDESGDPLTLSDYQTLSIQLGTSATGHGATVDGTYDGDSAALKIRGTRAQINAYLAGLQVDLGSGDEADTSYSVQVLVDDRLRDLATGALDGSGDANGGENPNSTDPDGATGGVAVPSDTAGQAPVDPYSATTSSLPLNLGMASRQVFLSTINDPANINAEDVTVTEGSATVTLDASKANLTVTDLDNNGGLVSGTIAVGEGTITAIGGSGVGTWTGIGTGTVTFSGLTLAQLNASLKALTITFADPDGAGDGAAENYNGSFEVTVAVNDGGSTGQRPGSLAGDSDDATADPGDYNYADDSSAELVTTRTITVTVNPANDAPSFGSSAGATTTVNESPDPNSGTTVVQIVTGANVGDVDLATTAGLASSVFGDGSITVSITGADSSEQLTIDLASLGGSLPAGITIDSASDGADGSDLVLNLSEGTTIAQVNAVLEAIRYHTTSDTLSGARTITITLNDGNNQQTGGNAGGPGPLTDTLTATITINEQNDPPASSDNAVTTNEDTAYTFAPADFGFTQPGGESDTLAGVRIDSLPADGQLLLNGVAVEAGDVVSLAQITGGQLTFEPNSNENGASYTSFDFSVQDSRGAFDTSPNVMTINVTPLNDTPVLAGTSANPALPINDDGSGTTDSAALLTNVSVTDADILKDADVDSFGGGQLTISFTDGYRPGDRLTVDGGELDGMAGPATGGIGGLLTITLSDDATAAQVAAILEAIRYSSVDADPTVGGTDTTRSYSIVLNDGNNNNDGGVGDGINDAGGPTALASNALTGTISFRAPPTATDDTNSMTKATPSVSGNVVTGGTPDSDAEDPTPDLTVTQVSHGATGNADTDPVGGFTVVGTHGTLQVAADGTYTYTLNTSDPAVAALAPADPDLHDVFTYEIADTDGTNDTATLTITITGENTAPTALDNSNSVVGDDPTPATGNLIDDDDGSGIDSDLEGDTLTVADVDGTPIPLGGSETLTGSYGSLTVNSDGSYSYTVDINNPDVLALPPLGSLTETFTYAIDDSSGGTDTAVLTITIMAPNTAPTAVDNANALGSRDTTPAAGNLVSDNDGSGADSDPENNALTVTDIAGTTVPNGGSGTVTGTYGTLTVDADGSYSYLLDVSDPAVASLPDGATLTETFTYTISDGLGGTDTATLTITITGTNAAPTALDNSNSVNRDDASPATGNLVADNDGSGVDSDPDNDALTVTDVAGTAIPNASSGTVTGTYGTLTVNADGSYSYVLDSGNSAVADLGSGDSLTETFTYTISDGRGGTATAELVITINANEVPPVVPRDEPNPPAPPTNIPNPPAPTTDATTGQPFGPMANTQGGGPAFTNAALRQQLSEVIPGFVIGDLDTFRQPLFNPIELSVALQDRVLAEGVQTFAIPSSAFRHTDPTEQLTIEATLPDGSPLPSFIIFDPDTGSFTVNTDIPRAQGLHAQDIRIVGRDTRGNEASSTFTVHFSDEQISTDDVIVQPAGNGQAAQQNGNGEGGQQDDEAPEDGKSTDEQEVPEESGAPQREQRTDRQADGRADTLTQLQSVGRQVVMAERDGLLADLLTIFDKVA